MHRGDDAGHPIYFVVTAFEVEDGMLAEMTFKGQPVVDRYNKGKTVPFPGIAEANALKVHRSRARRQSKGRSKSQRKKAKRGKGGRKGRRHR